jgi:hypothetical protein
MASTAEIFSSDEARAAKKAGFQRREAPSFPSAVEVISENRTSAWQKASESLTLEDVPVFSSYSGT